VHWPRVLRFGRLAALPAAVVVYMVVFLVTMLVPASARALVPWPRLGGLAGVLVALPMCSWSIRLVRRFLRRLVPLHAGGERLMIPALACVGGAIVAAVSLTGWAQEFVSLPASTWLEHPDLFNAAPACTWLIALTALAREYARGRPADDSYVLYLRTFLSFSDRAMMALLFSVIGSRTRIVVLTAPHSDAASWDPILIAFRGNPFFQLSAKVPLFVTATDADWQSSVRGLMQGATHTIIDVSALTPGVLTEIEMLRQLAGWDRVFWLCEASRVPAIEKIRGVVGGGRMPDERIILYNRSLAAAVPSLIGGLVLSLVILFVLPIVRNAQTGRLPQFDDTAEGIGRMLGAVFPATVFFLAVFLRAAVDPEAKRRLRAALASV
jgi:hypothetical protein